MLRYQGVLAPLCCISAKVLVSQVCQPSRGVVYVAHKLDEFDYDWLIQIQVLPVAAIKKVWTIYIHHCFISIVSLEMEQIITFACYYLWRKQC